MDRLKTLEIFRAVADRGSFSKAAEALNLSNAVASRAVQDLEAELGVRLLQRSTRSVSLTSEGREVLTRAEALLDAYEELLEASSQSTAEPAGEIRLSAPVSLGARHLGPVLASFMALHPLVRVDLQLRESPVDLIEEGIDLALHLGGEFSETRIVRRVGEARLGLFASPAYLQRQGVPQHPAELERHQCLTHGSGGRAATWRLQHAHGGERFDAAARGSLHSNNGDALLAAAICGSGIAMLPHHLVDQALARCELLPVLSSWQPEALGVHVSYSSRRNQPLRVRRLIDHLADTLQPALDAAAADGNLGHDGEVSAATVEASVGAAIEAAMKIQSLRYAPLRLRSRNAAKSQERMPITSV